MDSTSPTLDPSTGLVSFSIAVAGKRVACRVSEDWLRDAYGADAFREADALAVFSARRARVEAAALRAWLASRGVEPVSLKREHVWRQAAGERARETQPG